MLAAGPSGACLPFTTPCDVPAGWNQVERCPDETPEQAASFDIVPLLILIIIIVVLAAVIYKKRETIRDRLSSIRSRKGRSGEEFPRFEEE